MKGVIIDCFAGGGGASAGIEMALDVPVDIAVNHDPQAILMHKTNHPDTLHLTEDIFRVDLLQYTKGEDVPLMWASPDCTSHSKAKGGKPREHGLRILPWAVYKHAKAILPRVVIMENVEEIQKWGPLDENGHPIKSRCGEEYNRFIERMKNLGYDFDSRELIAADYGAPTTRKRWYAVFRRDGEEIKWPTPTHSKNGENGLKRWVPVSTVLNYRDLGKSIFDRKKPLVENTLKRIARGIKKFVIDNPNPFIFENAICFIDKAYGGGYQGCGSSTDVPLHTITTKDHNRLISAFITKFYKTGIGQGVDEPLHTITTSQGHFGQISTELMKFGVNELEKAERVAQFLMEYYGTGVGQSLNDPLHTIVTKDRFALVSVLGTDYVITDIFLRMLNPEELKLAQGFPKDYVIDRDYSGKPYPKSEQVKRIGNSVVPLMAKALVEANCKDPMIEKIEV